MIHDQSTHETSFYAGITNNVFRVGEGLAHAAPEVQAVQKDLRLVTKRPLLTRLKGFVDKHKGAVALNAVQDVAMGAAGGAVASKLSDMHKKHKEKKNSLMARVQLPEWMQHHAKYQVNYDNVSRLSEPAAWLLAVPTGGASLGFRRRRLEQKGKLPKLSVEEHVLRDVLMPGSYVAGRMLADTTQPSKFKNAKYSRLGNIVKSRPFIAAASFAGGAAGGHMLTRDDTPHNVHELMQNPYVQAAIDKARKKQELFREAIEEVRPGAPQQYGIAGTTVNTTGKALKSVWGTGKWAVRNPGKTALVAGAGIVADRKLLRPQMHKAALRINSFAEG